MVTGYLGVRLDELRLEAEGEAPCLLLCRGRRQAGETDYEAGIAVAAHVVVQTGPELQPGGGEGHKLRRQRRPSAAKGIPHLVEGNRLQFAGEDGGIVAGETGKVQLEVGDGAGGSVFSGCDCFDRRCRAAAPVGPAPGGGPFC